MTFQELAPFIAERVRRLGQQTLMTPPNLITALPLTSRAFPVLSTEEGSRAAQDILGVAMLGLSTQQGIQSLQGLLAQNQYNRAYQGVLNNLLSRTQGSLIPRGSEVSLQPEIVQAIYNRLFQVRPGIMNMYSGMPVKYQGGGYLEPSKAIPLLQSNPQSSWLLSQLQGYLRKQAPQEVGFLQGLPEKITKEEAIKKIEESIPSIDVMTKGGTSKQEVWLNRIAQEIYGDNFDTLTTEMQEEVKSEYQAARQSGEIDIEEFGEEKEIKEATKFSKYQLPGGENYREVLIRAPLGKEQEIALKGSPERPSWHADPELIARTFTSSHWDEPNVLAHLRVNDRTTPDGKKVLFIEEMQSDWAREARKPQNLDDIKHGNATPQHPLLKNWQETALKKVLKDGVDGDYDYISWTTGAQQAERYDLSKQLSKIQYTKYKNNKYGILGFKDNVAVIDKQNIDASELPNIVGKDIASKIQKFEGKETSAVNTKILSNIDLKIGGEWAKNLYDKQIPNILNDLTGGEVKNINLFDRESYKKSLKGLSPRQIGELKSGDSINIQQSIELTPEIKMRLKKQFNIKKLKRGHYKKD